MFMGLWWRRVAVVSGLLIGVAVVGLLAVVVYILLSGDGSDQTTEVTRASPTRVVSPTAVATPTPAPAIDAELSLECFGKWQIRIAWETLLQTPRSQLERMDTDDVVALGEKDVEAASFIRQNCLVTSVVPVPDPAADIPSVCVAAKTEAAMLSAQIAEADRDGYTTVAHVGLRAQLETFVHSYCD